MRAATTLLTAIALAESARGDPIMWNSAHVQAFEENVSCHCHVASRQNPIWLTRLTHHTGYSRQGRTEEIQKGKVQQEQFKRKATEIVQVGKETKVLC